MASGSDSSRKGRKFRAPGQGSRLTLSLPALVLLKGIASLTGVKSTLPARSSSLLRLTNISWSSPRLQTSSSFLPSFLFPSFFFSLSFSPVYPLAHPSVHLSTHSPSHPLRSLALFIPQPRPPRFSSSSSPRAFFFATFSHKGAPRKFLFPAGRTAGRLATFQAISSPTRDCQKNTR